MKTHSTYLLTLSTVIIVFATQVQGADPKTFDNHMNKSQADKNGPDHVQHELAGRGWFSNLGPTGIRAMLTDTEGKTEWQGKGIQYLVKYVFPESPADGIVKPGDVIVGVNGRKFQKPYVFGYWNGFGYGGPLTEFGDAVEECEAHQDGKLKLSVMRDGVQHELVVQMENKGAFAPTFPADCEKTKLLRQGAVEALVALQKPDGTWHSGFVSYHGSWMACMALLAQGKSHLEPVRKFLDNQQNIEITDGTWNWHLAMQGIAMAEYQMMTGDRRYQDHLLRISAQLKRNAGRYKNGTYGHVGLAEGSAGYGPMCGMTSFVLLSFAVMEKAGIPVPKEEYERARTEMDMALATGKDGCYPYGWPEQGKAVSQLDPTAVLTALGDLNADVESFHGKARTAQLPIGNMAMVHMLHPWQEYSPKVATHHVNRITRCRNVMLTGHGSGMLHGWGTFVALCMAYNRGDTTPLRLTLDYNKGLLNSARCYDGSFYAQPQRDDFGGDLAKGSRTTATALWLMVLSAPDKALVVLGRTVEE